MHPSLLLLLFSSLLLPLRTKLLWHQDTGFSLQGTCLGAMLIIPVGVYRPHDGITKIHIYKLNNEKDITNQGGGQVAKQSE